jgi:hypothetical protein
MSRLAALLGAVILVIGALWIHGDLDSDGEANGGNGANGEAPRLLCAAELGAVCERLRATGDVQVEIDTATNTTSRLAVAAGPDVEDPGFDAWLVPSPAAEIVVDERRRAQLEPLLAGRELRSVADSRLALVIWNDRRQVLADACETLDWKCIGEVAGEPWASIGGEPAWGTVKPGHANPSLDPIGLDVIGQAAAEYFGTTNLSTTDYEDGAFLGWFSQLENAVRPATGNTPLGQMLAAGPAAYDVVGTTDAEARPQLADAAPDRRRSIALTYPAPVARVDLVYAPVAGSERAEEIRDLLLGDGQEILEQAGWDVDRAGHPPRHEGLPDAGSLQALLGTWQDVTR